MALDYRGLVDAMRQGLVAEPNRRTWSLDYDEFLKHCKIMDRAGGLHEYKMAPWDMAKPGSDQTVVTAIPLCPIKPEWVEGFHPIVKAPVIPKQSEPDRIWDLIVLAAESSRYR